MPEAIDHAHPPSQVMTQALAGCGIDPAVGAQLQSAIDAFIAAQIRLERQRLEAERQRLEAQLQATFDERVANEVAAKVQLILEQNRLARHHRFGASSEAGQGQLFNEAEWLDDQGTDQAADEANEDNPDAAAQPSRATGSKRVPRKGRGHRRALPPELPRVEVIIDVPATERLDAKGVPMVRIGQQLSEQLDITPMKIRVIRTIRPRYAPVDGAGAPVRAAAAPCVLPRSNFSASAVAMLLTVKYADGLPLARFAKVLARHGVQVPRQTLARTAIAAAQALQPLANLMRDALLDGQIIGMDETRVQVLKEPGRAPSTQSFMWVQRGGPPGQPVVLFDYAPTRAGSVPMELLADWGGYLMTDDYVGYDQLVRQSSKQDEPIVHLACMAHARRKFVEAARASAKGRCSHADVALALFARLYRIEKRLRRASDALRYRARQKLSCAVLNELHVWLMDMLPKVPPKTKLGQALAYAHTIWPRLVRYIERGDLPIDNNACENAIRPFVIGRKAWLFADTPAGAHASAVIYSLVETARANGREPYAWLLYVLERLPLAKDVDAIEALLPWNVHDQDLAMNLAARQ